jgi:outer membrane protein assembly factor BamB
VSYDPTSGKETWRNRHGDGFSLAPRPVFGHGMVYVCTGAFVPELWAIRTDAQGSAAEPQVVWKAKGQIPIMSSPILVGDEIYCVSDTGIVSCFDALTGKLYWRERLGGTYFASPVCAGGRLYFFDRDGKTTVLRAAKQFERLAENQLEGPMIATPAVVHRSILLRTDKYLYCIERR